MRPHSRSLIPLLAACSVFAPLGNFLFLPALPVIANEFNAPVAAAQLTVTVYLIANAVGVLFSGPLADRYGRKPLLLVGLTLAGVGFVAGLVADTLTGLVIARAIQGAGGAVGITVARATVGDLYQGPPLSRALATLTMAMVIGSATAPYLGGLIAQSLGWRAGFWFLLAGAIAIVVAVAWGMPETRSKQLLDQSFARIWQESRAVVARPVFLAYVLQAGVIYAQFLVFISIAPHIMTNVLQIPPAHFGLYYLFLSGGYFLGNFYVARAGQRVSGTKLIHIGLAIQAVFAFVALGLALLGFNAPLYIFGAQFALTLGQGLALPNVAARGVALAPGYAGVASSVMGFAQMAIAASCVQLMGFAPTDSWIPVLTFCVVIACIAWITAMILERRTANAA